MHGLCLLVEMASSYQVGHQAEQCTNGTINWKGIYGEEAFILKEPLYHSDYERIAQEKKVDLEDLAARAAEYARVSKFLQCWRLLAAGICYTAAPTLQTCLRTESLHSSWPGV